MEIFSYVLEGELAHKDSLGNGRTLKPGQIQLMSAGRGVTHSEFNPSRTDGLHFLQIWIQPRERGLTPSYTEWQPKRDNDSQPKVHAIIAQQGSNSLLAAAIGNDWKGKLSLVLYAAAIPLAFVSPWIASAMYVAVAFNWLVPDRRIERVLARRETK